MNNQSLVIDTSPNNLKNLINKANEGPCVIVSGGLSARRVIEMNVNNKKDVKIISYSRDIVEKLRGTRLPILFHAIDARYEFNKNIIRYILTTGLSNDVYITSYDTSWIEPSLQKFITENFPESLI